MIKEGKIVHIKFIKFSYFYVLVFLFFYKVRILSILCSSSEVENALCCRMVLATRRQQ